MSQAHSFTTNSIHAGEDETTSATPIFLGATSSARYLRSGNPTLDAFEEKVRALEDGAMAISTACGMAAVSQTLLTLLKPGKRLLVHQTVYFWSTELVQTFLPSLGVIVETVDMRDPVALAEALAKKPDVVYFEPLSNPTCEVLDTATIIKAAKAAGATVVLDNTFLSPALLNPLPLGADVVLHSATKFLCGHGDALAGVIVTREQELGEAIHHTRSTLGGILSPFNSYLLLRGIKTMTMRVDRHCHNAQRIAEFLADQPKIRSVQYPGLADAQGYEIAKAQWRGFGGMINFQFHEVAEMDRFIDKLEMIKPWVSLGDAATLAVGGEHFGGPTHVRLAVGLEDIDDILADLRGALV